MPDPQPQPCDSVPPHVEPLVAVLESRLTSSGSTDVRNRLQAWTVAATQSAAHNIGPRQEHPVKEPLTDEEVLRVARLLWRNALKRDFDEAPTQHQEGARTLVNALWAKHGCPHTPETVTAFMTWMGNHYLALRTVRQRWSKFW